MTFSEAVRDAFSKYATFHGRSSRSAYWWWYLFTIIVVAVGAVIDVILGTGGVVAGLISLAILLPNLAVLVRRLHDAGHSVADRAPRVLCRPARLHPAGDQAREQLGRRPGHARGPRLSSQTAPRTRLTPRAWRPKGPPADPPFLSSSPGQSLAHSAPTEQTRGP